MESLTKRFRFISLESFEEKSSLRFCYVRKVREFSHSILYYRGLLNYNQWAIRGMNTKWRINIRNAVFLVPIGSRFRNRVKILVRHRGNPGTEISGYDILPVMQPFCCGICAFEQEVVREKAESPSLNEFTRYMKRLYSASRCISIMKRLEFAR